MLSTKYLRNFQLDASFEEEYLNHIPALKYLKKFEFSKPVTFLVGENGSGKSTLLEALAVAYGFNPEGGSKNFNFSTKVTHSSLYKQIHISKGIKLAQDGFFLRAESFYNVATDMERIAGNGLLGEAGSQIFYQNNYGGKSLHEQSHGESFLALMLHRFKGNSLFFLDEPEAALSPTRQMTLLAQIDKLVSDNAQFIIATHSPILMAYPQAEILEIKETGVQLTPYQETEHYTLTKRFLNQSEKMLRYLLEEE